MESVKKEQGDLQGPGVVNYVLEQLAEVTTVKNEHGVDEELYILYPPRKTDTSQGSGNSNVMSNATEFLSKRKSPQKSREIVGSKGTGETDGIKQEKEQSQDETDDKVQCKIERGASSPGNSRKRGRPSKMNVQNEMGYECSNCQKVFSLKGNLKVHMKIHSGDKPFVCSHDGCEKSFISKDALKKHLNSHTGEKLWKCASCSKGFSSKVALIEHEARHSNTKAYKCDLCQMEFRQYSCMSRHMLTHKEEFRYSCTICQKKFKMAIYLKSHMRVHTGETPYECPTCQKKFKHQSDLTRHKIIHSGTKPYACEVCGVRFSDNSCRRRHEREHLTKSTFKCKLCNMSYKKIEKLKSHLISAHFSQQDLASCQSDITSLMKELDQAVQQEGGEAQASDLMQQATEASHPQKAAALPITLTPAGNVLEKRMITHHVSVPRVQGQPVVIDPYSLLEHIKDQLDPSQMPQTINGEALQVCHKIIQDNTDHVIVELQYLSTVQVAATEMQGAAVTVSTMDKTPLNCEQFLPVTVEGNSAALVQQQQQVTIGVSGLSELNAPTEFIATVAVESAANIPNNDIENLGAFIDVSEIEERESGTLKTSGEDSIIGRQGDCNETAVEHEETIAKGKASQLLNSQLTDSYVKFPDFSSQYFIWLQEFCEVCKGLKVPLEQHVFETISTINKKLADVMASPKGAMTDKTKFITCFSVSKELTGIIESQHNYILNCINQNKLIS